MSSAVLLALWGAVFVGLWFVAEHDDEERR